MKVLAKHLPRLIVTFILATALGHIGSSHLLYGQAVNGTLLGTITDTNNAVVGGATVNVTDVNTTVRRDLELEPGSVAEQVTVTADEAALQTDRADTGRQIESKQIAELPLGFNR